MCLLVCGAASLDPSNYLEVESTHRRRGAWASLGGLIILIILTNLLVNLLTIHLKVFPCSV